MVLAEPHAQCDWMYFAASLGGSSTVEAVAETFGDQVIEVFQEFVDLLKPVKFRKT